MTRARPTLVLTCIFSAILTCTAFGPPACARPPGRTGLLSSRTDKAFRRAKLTNHILSLSATLDKAAETPPRFRVAQYNILASYLGNNREPWFLFGALTRSTADQERARQVAIRHQAIDKETGNPLYKGWEQYTEGILSAAEKRAVEQRDAEVFSWTVRQPKIAKTILSLDADLVSLVELDRYEEFFRDTFEREGYGSFWMKRPRNNSKDGCAILYRKTKLKLLDSSGFAYNDDIEGNRKDRVALMGLFQMHHAMDGEDDRLIFVSTHLARNPEDETQNEIRIRQVSELMIELRMFANTHDALNVPVIVAGDWNAETIETLRFMSLALFSLQHIFQDAHPMLLGGIDIVTAKTAFTMQRQSRIDYLLYQDNLLRPVSQQIYPAESDLKSLLASQKCIPNEEHPSDHLPVWADFEIASRLQVARECAQVRIV